VGISKVATSLGYTKHTGTVFLLERLIPVSARWPSGRDTVSQERHGSDRGSEVIDRV